MTGKIRIIVGIPEIKELGIGTDFRRLVKTSNTEQDEEMHCYGPKFIPVSKETAQRFPRLTQDKFNMTRTG